MALPDYLVHYMADAGIQQLDECVGFVCADHSGTLLFSRLSHEVLVTAAPIDDDTELSNDTYAKD